MPMRPPAVQLYRITNTVNGKAYIGVTKHPKVRFRKHCKSDNKKPTLLNFAIAKHGAENFLMEILCVAPEDYCYDLEIKAIAAYNTRTPFGYNATIGGGGVKGRYGAEHHLYGQPRSVKTKNKISAANKGQKLTEEQLAKMKKALTGRHLSDETKAKISAAKKGFVLNAEQLAKISKANTGKKHSQATIEKIKQAQKGKVFSAEAKASISAGLAKKWQDPEFRSRMMIARQIAKEKRLESPCH